MGPRSVSQVGGFLQDKRPINKNPLSVRLPIGAWVSISHRLSGILVFLLMPLLLWIFARSLSPEGFAQIKAFSHSPWGGIGLFLLLTGGIFHFLAGIRHLLMDCQIGESLKASRLSAKIVIALSLLVMGGIFYALWGRL